MEIRGEQGESVQVTWGPLGGDLLVGVVVELGDYRGSAETWVLEPAWSAFRRQLVALESTRRGSARLESITPGELVLEVFSTDACGHMGIRGRLARVGLQATVLEFGTVAFDPCQLAGILASLEPA